MIKHHYLMFFTLIINQTNIKKVLFIPILLFVCLGIFQHPVKVDAASNLTISSAILASDGQTITANISGVSGSLSPSSGVSGFTVNVGGSPVAVTSATSSGSTVTINVTTVIIINQTVTVDLATSPTSNLTDTGGNTPTGQTGFAVTNNSTKYFTSIASVVASGGVNGATTSAVDTTGAKLIVIAISSNGATSPTVTDSVGGHSNTYTFLKSQSDSINSWSKLYYSITPTYVGPGHTFTVSGASTYSNIAVEVFNSYDDPVYTGENSSATANASSISPGAITPALDAEQRLQEIKQSL